MLVVDKNERGVLMIIDINFKESETKYKELQGLFNDMRSVSIILNSL